MLVLAAHDVDVILSVLKRLYSTSTMDLVPINQMPYAYLSMETTR